MLLGRNKRAAERVLLKEAASSLPTVGLSSGRLTADEASELAGSLDQFRGTFLRKTAVLCPRERFDNAKFFSLLAGSHGFRHIRAFLNYEDAMEWLLASGD